MQIFTYIVHPFKIIENIDKHRLGIRYMALNNLYFCMKFYFNLIDKDKRHRYMQYMCIRKI
jgi:hypothetical protein